MWSSQESGGGGGGEKNTFWLFLDRPAFGAVARWKFQINATSSSPVSRLAGGRHAKKKRKKKANGGAAALMLSLSIKPLRAEIIQVMNNLVEKSRRAG